MKLTQTAARHVYERMLAEGTASVRTFTFASETGREIFAYIGKTLYNVEDCETQQDGVDFILSCVN